MSARNALDISICYGYNFYYFIFLDILLDLVDFPLLWYRTWALSPQHTQLCDHQPLIIHFLVLSLFSAFPCPHTMSDTQPKPTETTQAKPEENRPRGRRPGGRGRGRRKFHTSFSFSRIWS